MNRICYCKVEERKLGRDNNFFNAVHETFFCVIHVHKKAACSHYELLL